MSKVVPSRDDVEAGEGWKDASENERTEIFRRPFLFLMVVSVRSPIVF